VTTSRLRMRSSHQIFSSLVLQAPTSPGNRTLMARKPQEGSEPRTLSLELFTNGGKRSNANSFASGMFCNQGVKL